MSVAAYLIDVAVPVNVGSGSNVTTPVAVSNVYEPSPATVNVVVVHDAATVTDDRQIPAGDIANDVPEPAVSFP